MRQNAKTTCFCVRIYVVATCHVTLTLATAKEFCSSEINIIYCYALSHITISLVNTMLLALSTESGLAERHLLMFRPAMENTLGGQ